ncbi:MAG: membrane-bound lytic murein transglycosylase MltF [Steroidobacteraceae bacterium]
MQRVTRVARCWSGGLAALALAGLCACAPEPSVLEQIQSRGQLRVVTLNAPTTYYLGSDGPEGYEYRLTRAFARELGVQLVIQQVRDTQAMRDALASGEADLAAAQITASDEWKRIGYATGAYQEITQFVVQRRGQPRPRNIAALRGARVVVRAGSPQGQLLHDIRGTGIPYLAWTELPREQADPLDWLSSNDADYAIVDSDEYAFVQHLFPDTVVAFTLPDPRPAQWIARRGDLSLRNAANHFIATARRAGVLDQVARASAPDPVNLDYESARQFQVDIAQRLPQLQPMFEAAAQDSGLDWRLLAAVGYQESKWEGAAQSANGAQGIMMLTASTATSVGVKDRSDIEQNIRGGARYLSQVIGMIPERIAQPDRLWLALAAYNVGYGHLEDARILTQMRGGNPDKWDDVRAQLPLLTQEQWYSQLKRGYARGWEPASFVEQVRQFLAVLEWVGAGTLAQHHAPLCPAPALSLLGSSRRAASGAPCREESFDQFSAFAIQHTAEYIDAVI